MGGNVPIESQFAEARRGAGALRRLGVWLFLARRVIRGGAGIVRGMRGELYLAASGVDAQASRQDTRRDRRGGVLRNWRIQEIPKF